MRWAIWTFGFLGAIASAVASAIVGIEGHGRLAMLLQIGVWTGVCLLLLASPTSRKHRGS